MNLIKSIDFFKEEKKLILKLAKGIVIAFKTCFQGQRVEKEKKRKKMNFQSICFDFNLKKRRSK